MNSTTLSPTNLIKIEIDNMKKIIKILEKDEAKINYESEDFLKLFETLHITQVKDTRIQYQRDIIDSLEARIKNDDDNKRDHFLLRLDKVKPDDWKIGSLKSLLTKDKCEDDYWGCSDICTYNKESIKVFIIGSYKVGKTTITETLSESLLNAHIVTNTRGQLLLEKPIVNDFDKKDILFIDNEGFAQPVVNSDPHIIREFILEQVNNMADCVILVVNRMYLHEYEMFQILKQQFESGKGSKIKQFIVIHNLKEFDRIEEAQKIIKRNIFKIMIDDPEKLVDQYKRHDQNQKLGYMRFQTPSKFNTIKHFVLINYRNFEVSNKFNLEQLEEIKRCIKDCPSNEIPFQIGYKSAAENLFHKYYKVHVQFKLCYENKTNCLIANIDAKPRINFRDYTLFNFNNFTLSMAQQPVEDVPRFLDNKEEDLNNEIEYFGSLEYITCVIDCPGLLINKVELKDMSHKLLRLTIEPKIQNCDLNILRLDENTIRISGYRIRLNSDSFELLSVSRSFQIGRRILDVPSIDNKMYQSIRRDVTGLIHFNLYVSGAKSFKLQITDDISQSLHENVNKLIDEMDEEPSFTESLLDDD